MNYLIIDKYSKLKINFKETMKKILFVIAACLTMGFASCGNKTASTFGADNDSIAADSVDSVEVVDSLSAE